jgi:hypothetical protein
MSIYENFTVTAEKNLKNIKTDKKWLPTLKRLLNNMLMPQNAQMWPGNIFCFIRESK